VKKIQGKTLLSQSSLLKGSGAHFMLPFTTNPLSSYLKVLSVVSHLTFSAVNVLSLNWSKMALTKISNDQHTAQSTNPSVLIFVYLCIQIPAASFLKHNS
jgi:hypothetical protein